MALALSLVTAFGGLTAKAADQSVDISIPTSIAGM